VPAAYRSVALGPRAVALQRRSDGTIVLRSTTDLAPYPVRFTEPLFAAAHAHPQRLFLAERAPDGQWRQLTYAQAAQAVRSIGAALLARGLSLERPIAILSGSSIEHALLALAAMHVGISFAPVAPAYSLNSRDFSQLRHVMGLLTPGLIFAQSGGAYARALEHAPSDAELVVQESAPGRAATSFEELLRTSAGAGVELAHARVGPDSVAKVLFTSGSTGMPKGVINTHRMLCCNQQMFLQSLPLIATQPPVLVDWLPWHHTSGGNQILGMTVYNAGTLYIDGGRPLPQLIATTVRNLKEIAPTAYFTVPRGYAELIPHLEADRELRERFFSRVSMFYYSGAALAHGVIEQLQALAVRACGERIPFLCGYGATETAPFALCVNWIAERGGLAGLPVPGVELKLAPRGDKYEACVRGPSVTPGYWRQGALTAALFDSEGYLRTGDALSWVDRADPAQGLAFDGRLAENFKLSSGTWVGTAALRTRLIAAAHPLIQDVVIVGENRDEVAALIFPDLTACAALYADAARGGVPADPRVRAGIQSALDRLACESTGSSTFIARALVLEEPPDAQVGEVTDKGSINRAAVLSRRASLVSELYAANPTVYVYRALAP
jgi:feruloyl-CoA synthase